MVKAKGMGNVAEKIIQLAQEHNIPIKEDPDLVELLVQLDLDQEIPPELYKIVAEILAFVYNLDRSRQSV
jgi:flagellar biosynthesis protein